MVITEDVLNSWLNLPENEHLEFKEARTSFSKSKLLEYCVAFSNEGGGTLVLGVTDRVPRRVVGTQAFLNVGKIKGEVYDQLRMRVSTTELPHSEGRVVIFEIPPCPPGTPLDLNGRFLMRSGEGLVPMSADRMRQIMDDSFLDFSAGVCDGATIADLDPRAVAEFRTRWRRKSEAAYLDSLSDEQALYDAEFISDRGVTYAALILLGSRDALGKHLPQAEVIFEYRSDDASIRHQQRREFREGFLLFADELWELVNLRNDVYHVQNGLFMLDVPSFNEEAVREAILNAVAHRDYRRGGSVFVRQTPTRLRVESPGGFPPGVTVENILSRQFPRNRRVAEALTRCGLVERSGQGMNLMFDRSIREGKLPPDFSDTDDYEVHLTLHGDVQDVRFLQFLERVGNETTSSFAIEDLLVLDLVHRELDVPNAFRSRIARLRDLGVVEVQGKGRGTRYLLSRRFYDFAGESGTYTQRRGLDRETNKALLLRHIEENQTFGSQFREFQKVLPALSRDEIQSLLRELKADGKAHTIGVTRAARWFPGRQAAIDNG